MSMPPIVTCPNCFTVDEVTLRQVDGEWIYSCIGGDHGGTAHEWTVATSTKPNKPHDARDGNFADLGVYDLLLDCVSLDDPWLEYGVVEDRFRRKAPELYADLVHRYSHSARNSVRGGPDVAPPRAQTASMRLAHALGVLRAEGLLEMRNGNPTGYWATYLSTVSYWSLVGSVSDDDLTWERYAQRLGMNPREWALP